MNWHDMRMVKVCNDAGFLQVSLDVLRARYSIWSRDLDCNRAVEVFVVSEKHLPEAAFSKTSQKGVTPDFGGTED
jgi:hypothetical protein